MQPVPCLASRASVTAVSTVTSRSTWATVSWSISAIQRRHEDDPEQAVRAGLELVAAVRGLQMPEPLEARVGIATGLVVVGDLIGSGASQERPLLARHQTFQHGYKGSLHPAWSSLLTARVSYSEICLSLMT
jgi:hypothetical protein